jgi:predicted HTH domain antitoxin
MSDVAAKTPDADSKKPFRFGRNFNWLVAELVVVVMGVVLGLAFSAWWQDFQDHKDSLLSLARLSENLTTTLHDLQGDIETMEQSAEAARMLINSKPSDRTPESAALALARIFDTRTPVAETAEYQALTSTGTLRDIVNPKIVTAVTSIYEQLPYLIRLSDENERIASELRTMVAISLVYQDIPSFDLDAPIFTLNEGAEELLTRADVRAQIVSAGYWAAFQARRYRSVILGIKDVLAEIDNELR